MTPELDRRLVKTFPILYRDRHGNQLETNMIWGFEHGDGWFDIVWTLSEKLEKIAKTQPPPQTRSIMQKLTWPSVDAIAGRLRRRTAGGKPVPFGLRSVCNFFWGPVYSFAMPTEDNRLKAVQVKEKFATLRFYVDNPTNEALGAIREAEIASARICEECGQPGKTRGKQWIMTRCDECWQHEITNNNK